MTKILTRKEVEALDCTWFGGGAVLQDTALALYDVATAAREAAYCPDHFCPDLQDTCMEDLRDALAKLPEGE
jgi:hypothetical protein